MTDHPITPPPELLDQWANEYWGEGNDGIAAGEKHIATQAARWGADQELEACCKTLDDIWDDEDVVTIDDFLRRLRAIRRPKPPSLKKQALEALHNSVEMQEFPKEYETIRLALETLPIG
jgi:hypothetical protein